MDTAKTATNASEAFLLYKEALDADALIQSGWHSRAEDGRALACALGILGPEVRGANDCPAEIMPLWLAKMVPEFFDRQSFDDAKDWGLRFYAALDRIGGKVPFSVVHDWNANTVTVLAIDVAQKRGRDHAPHVDLQELHKRACAGELIPEHVWRPVLKRAYADAYATYAAYAAYAANANAYAAYAAYAANANAYAAYAANANAYAGYAANANANANAAYAANANANADANADAHAYATYAAYAYADAHAVNPWKLLANGMVDALNRVAVS